MFDTDLVPIRVDRPKFLGILAADDDGGSLYPAEGGDSGGAWGSSSMPARAAEAVARSASVQPQQFAAGIGGMGGGGAPTPTTSLPVKAPTPTPAPAPAPVPAPPAATASTR